MTASEKRLNGKRGSGGRRRSRRRRRREEADCRRRICSRRRDVGVVRRRRIVPGRDVDFFCHREELVSPERPVSEREAFEGGSRAFIQYYRAPIYGLTLFFLREIYGLTQRIGFSRVVLSCLN
jgi:hypothetical protein